MFNHLDNNSCKGYLVDLFKELLEMNQLMLAEDALGDNYKTKLKRLLDNSNPQTAQIECIVEWERVLQLNNIGTITERRAKILHEISSHVVINEFYILALIKAHFGLVPYQVVISHDRLNLMINVDNDLFLSRLISLEQQLRRMVPLNIELHINNNLQTNATAYVCASILDSNIQSLSVAMPVLPETENLWLVGVDSGFIGYGSINIVQYNLNAPLVGVDSGFIGKN